MKVLKNNKNQILIEYNSHSFLIIEQNGQLQLKNINAFVQLVIPDKQNLIQNITYENIDKDLEDGLNTFIVEILNQCSIEPSIKELK